MKEPVSISSELNDDLGKLIANSHKAFCNRATVDATNLTEAESGNEELIAYENLLRAKYKRLWDEVRAIIKADDARVEGASIKQRNEFKANECKRKISENGESLRILNASRRSIGCDYDWKRYPRLLSSKALVILAEAAFNTFAFTLLGSTVLFAIPTAIGFAMATGIVSYAIPRFISRLSVPSVRLKASAVFSVVMLLVFLMIGILRANTVDGSYALHLTISTVLFAFAFAVVNGFLFLAVVVIGFQLPSKEQFLEKRELDRLTKCIKEKALENEALECKINKLSEETHEKLVSLSAVINQESRCHALIDSMVEECIDLFRIEISIRRRRHTPTVN